ncbi:MAG: hypothetical protein HY067_07795 [Betaproteobacteria bacterium]|nr:hypothetical protein [Betaproteobacteria bacterium]
MKNLLFALGITVVAALAAIGAGSVSWVFWEAWQGSDREAFRALLGAFSGAFFAFLFVRFGEGLKRIYERKEKHHTSLVRLQHYFNDCLNITGDNIFIVVNFLSVFDEKRLQSNDLPIFINRFHEYPIDRELVIGLTNLDFANDVYTLNVELRKLNDSLVTIDRSYARIAEAFISKKIDPAMYVANIRHSRGRYVEMREFLLQEKLDLIRLFASSNLLTKDAPFLVRVIRVLTKSSYSSRFKTDLPTEVKRVSAEIDAGAKNSRLRIEEVQARAAQPAALGDVPPKGVPPSI